MFPLTVHIPYLYDACLPRHAMLTHPIEVMVQTAPSPATFRAQDSTHTLEICSRKVGNLEKMWQTWPFAVLTAAHLQLAATCSHLRPLAATCSQQPLAATCSHRRILRILRCLPPENVENSPVFPSETGEC